MSFHIRLATPLTSPRTQLADGLSTDRGSAVTTDLDCPLHKAKSHEEDLDEGSSYFTEETDLGTNSSDLSYYGDTHGWANEQDVVRKDEVINYPLAAMKRSLLDRMMAEFWAIFNEDWPVGKTCAGSTSTSSRSQRTFNIASTTSTSRSSVSKRKRDDPDDLPPGDGDDGSFKRPQSRSSTTGDFEIPIKLACPFRKRDPSKYSIEAHRTCALNHWPTVARVK